MPTACILCVDDDPAVLRSLTAQLQRRYTAIGVSSAAAGLEALARDPEIAVVISDMHMPEMHGVAFLTQVRERWPDTTRILLTGDADTRTAIDAVNEGQIFRFLTKPWPVMTLLLSVDDAVAHHRMVTAERVLLEHTLRGSIRALTDVLALADPMSFGRATRVRTLVAELAAALHIDEPWQVEVAAMLSQLACIALPAETVESLHYGHPLSAEELLMVERLPTVTEQLLSNIPRLDVVRQMLRAASLPPRHPGPLESPDAHQAATGAILLRTALDYDRLESRGLSSAMAVGVMRGADYPYDRRTLDALAQLRTGTSSTDVVSELPASELRSGMVFLEDIHLAGGLMLAARGSVITPGLLARIQNLPSGGFPRHVRVRVPG